MYLGLFRSPIGLSPVFQTKMTETYSIDNMSVLNLVPHSESLWVAPCKETGIPLAEFDVFGLSLSALVSES